MNRNKKTFTPNMRVAALYLLMGVLLLLAVTLFSGRESIRATEEYFDRTINFVKVQSTSYEKYNDTITAKSLRRMAVSVRQLAENDALDLYDPESLRAEKESLWLTGIAVLDENGELERKADMFTKRTIKPHTPVTSVDTVSEALAVSMGEKACVDMEYMCSLTGKTEQEIYEELKGVIFLNPTHELGSAQV